MWATNGDYLVCYSDDGKIRYFDLSTGKLAIKWATAFDSADHVLKSSTSNLFIKLSNSECTTFVIQHFKFDSKMKENELEMDELLAVLDKKKDE